MFGTLGGPELFLIFVVALIVFGPRKLPDIGKSLGRMMSEFRRASNEFKSTIESEVESEKIRESMRLEPPRVTSRKDKDSTKAEAKGSAAAATAAAEGAANGEGPGGGDVPASSESKAPTDEPAQDDGTPTTEGASSSEGSSRGDEEKSEARPAADPSTGEPVPSTVSRQPPAPESK